MKKTQKEKWHKALRMRVDGKSMAAIARALKVSTKTISRWENGWIDKDGIRHRGWKEELRKVWKEKESEALEFGLMLKEERLKAYEKLARMAIDKVTKMLPSIEAKTPAQAKALMSEVRELCRLLAIEKGDYRPGSAKVSVKEDITLEELQERYFNAHKKLDED